MNSKKWAIAFVSLIVLTLIGIMALNFVVDPYGYFAAQGGDCFELDEKDYLRELKAEHIKNFGDQYDAYLIGGSKAGAIRAEKLSELDGYNYYNAWVLSGNFLDYEGYIEYILENTKAKKILLQISTSELKDISRENYGDTYKIPAEITGDSKIEEYVRFLMKNPSVAWDELTGEKVQKYPCLPTGERNLTKYYNYYNSTANEKPDNEYFNYLIKNSKKFLKYAKNGAPNEMDTMDVVVESMRNIKKMCDKKGVELQVFYAPIFVGQMFRYEGESFYQMLEQSVSIFGEVWCFSRMDNFALCPYNYYNSAHYFYEMGDLIVDTMAGKDTGFDDFGVILTRENVGNEIVERKAKIEEWREYYLKNGTLPYLDYNSRYNLKKIYG